MMPEFFHGWRRKTGCVALVIAFAFMIAWIRSLCVTDLIRYPSTACSLYSRHGYYGLIRHGEFWDSSGSPHWFGGDADFIVPEFPGDRTWLAPYWSITVPLTIVAAYLILWPGKRRPDSP